MGNAAITIQHPTSLDHGIPYMEAGKIENGTTSMIRLEKKDGSACGCGGRVQFRKNVLESHWSYKVTKQLTTGFDIGQEGTVKGAEKSEATYKIAAKFSISVTEARESIVLIKSVISDNNSYSELYCYVDYEGKNNGRYNWTKNDLNLKATHRWAEDSELIIDINFKQ